LQQVHTSSRHRSTRESSDEKEHSLLDINEEEEITTTTTVKSVNESHNETVPNSEAKPKSRKLQLPDDYNKLEIPRRPTFKSVTKLIPNFDQFTPEQRIMSEQKYLAGEPPPLQVATAVKVQNIRNIDELNEVRILQQV